MTLEKFKDYMTDIQTFTEDYNKAREYINVEVMDNLYLPCNSLINLLSEQFNDESDWIGYWVYDLDLGTKWKEGTVIDNGKDVKLKTVEDLYVMLIGNT